jgi:hypothetical protein
MEKTKEMKYLEYCRGELGEMYDNWLELNRLLGDKGIYVNWNNDGKMFLENSAERPL